MNFYARQAQARRQTRWLVVLFVLALGAVVCAVDFIVLTLIAVLETDTFAPLDSTWLQARPVALVVTSLLVLAVVGSASLFKTLQLSSGGGVVAQSLGGTRIDRSVHDILQRRLFNVVEEIAIASGVPLPEIYVLEHEEGINAFAAGYLPANAAVAVTRGALENLNRAELQGVIAHEFGHVLNGDMRLNTRLIGLTFGLLVVALIGRTILRLGPRRGRKGGGALMLAALAVMILGYLGVFFGRLIQAAVARGRESLADASAVQFTRDPQGLKGALVKIGALTGGSQLHSPAVDEVAHMLFAAGMKRLFATHPPLIARIKALDPSFHEREFAAVRLDPQLAPIETRPAAAPLAENAKAVVELITSLVGNFSAEQVAAARHMTESLPTGWFARPGGPAAVLLASALDAAATVRSMQLKIIGECAGAQSEQQVQEYFPHLNGLERAQKLALLQQSIPELRRLPRAERRKLVECLGRVVLCDGRIDIFEYALATLARVYLQDELQPPTYRRPMTFKHAAVELQAVFSTLAQHGARSEQEAQHAYELGMHHLLPQRRLPFKPVSGWSAALDRALKCLDRLAPAEKRRFIEALVLTIGHDGRLTQDEAELLRAICASIHCPLPLLSGVLAAPSASA